MKDAFIFSCANIKISLQNVCNYRYIFRFVEHLSMFKLREKTAVGEHADMSELTLQWSVRPISEVI